MDNHDFADAAKAVASIMGKIPNDKIKAAAKAVRAAAPVVGVAAQAAPAVAKAVAPTAKKAGHAVAGAAGSAKDKVAGAAGYAKEKAADAARSSKVVVADKVASARLKHQERQAQREARQSVLAGAPAFVDASDLLAQAGDGSVFQTTSFLDYPGCYAAVTYGKLPKSKDLAAYQEVQVCFAPDMGASMHADLTGSGDPDVYANVKYKQHVRFYLYPCSAEDAHELLPSLMGVLAEGENAEAENSVSDREDIAQEMGVEASVRSDGVDGE